jgi:hypothetical protein
MTSSRKGASAVNAKTDTKLLVAMTGKASQAAGRAEAYHEDPHTVDR